MPISMPFSLPSTSSIKSAFRLRKTYTINEAEPMFYCTYLGNVLTVIAKGEAAVAKPLALIWKTYESRARPDMPMKLTITRSGLKAETKQQGLTEYWAHRTTFCVAPKSHPRVFVWVYKHDGKKMKPELRCHAVLCRRSSEPSLLALKLAASLQMALAEYRREKAAQEQARERSGSLPMRRDTLATGSKNFRPPNSQCSRAGAPKLNCIDEDTEDEEEPILPTHTAICATSSTSSMTSEDDTSFDDLGDTSVCPLPTLRCSTSSTASTGSETSTVGGKDSMSDESGYHDKASDDKKEWDNDVTIVVSL